MALTWTRVRDGDHNGRPICGYIASVEDRYYKIVWASDHGGTFGYTAMGSDGSLTNENRIHWCGALWACKDHCERIERTFRPSPPKPALVPNIAGQFDTFEDWCNRATRALADRTCDSSGCLMPVPAICVDTKGRRCYQGSDFMRARDEGAFPVVYFWDCKLEI